MSQIKAQQALTKLVRNVARVKVNLKNMAEKSSHAAVNAMRREAKQVAWLAARYAPFYTGLLDGSTGSDSFLIFENKGLRGRKDFSVELNTRKWKTVGDRRVSLSKYAKMMHTGYTEDGKEWKLGNGYRGKGGGSIDKARLLNLATEPNDSGKYVGKLFLLRAARQRREVLEDTIARSIREGLK